MDKTDLTPTYLPSGDRAVLVQFAPKIDAAINRYIHSLCSKIDDNPFKGLIEYQPSYSCLIVHYDPMLLTYNEVTAYLEKIISITGSDEELSSSVVEIPVCYGGDHGPDLPFVAAHLGRSEEDVVACHTGENCLVCFLGFTPGFPLSQAPEKLAGVPRLETPRTKVPAGSVGVVGNQTGVYPISSPGGWRLIGRTPLKLYDPGRDEPFLVKPGDYIRFKAISAEEYAAYTPATAWQE